MPEVEGLADRAIDALPSDEEIVRRVRQGDVASFEIVMRRYNQRLYRLARAIVRDDAEAEDVVQQSYLNAYLHLDQFADRARFSTWLTKIAIYEALARVRRSARRSALAEVAQLADHVLHKFESKSPDPERQAFARELALLLEAAVDALPEIYRVVFMLREVEGLSTLETAECLDLSEDSVKTRLHRARSLLRDHLYARAGMAAPDVFQFKGSRCDRVVRGVFDRLSALAPPQS
jgi:RNA polymerase sigma-70 factor (ECF subfamily)